MGKLYIVPTPIGNLADMTYRSVEVLKTVDLILAEDTRTTGKLLQHYDISKPMRAYHKHNEHKIATAIADELSGGEVAYALVSDAGTPGISDPAYLLVKACVDSAVEIICLPGATAFVPALVKSGLPTTRFCFEGFLPHKKGRQTKLTALAAEERTMIFYESPYRVVRTLAQMAEHFGTARRVSVSREISKLYESTFNGTLEEAIAYYEANTPKGEFVLVIDGVSTK